MDRERGSMTDLYYVFNPKADKPKVLYHDYDKALEDAKDVSKRELTKVFVLKVMAICNTIPQQIVTEIRDKER